MILAQLAEIGNDFPEQRPWLSCELLQAHLPRHIIIIIIILSAHQHKAAGRKTRLHIQNYGYNCNLLCDHGVVERNRISSLGSHYYYYYKAVGKISADTERRADPSATADTCPDLWTPLLPRDAMHPRY